LSADVTTRAMVAGGRDGDVSTPAAITQHEQRLQQAVKKQTSTGASMPGGAACIQWKMGEKFY